MIIISHRGNTNGVNINKENNPTHIQTLLDINIHVEIDVWVIDEGWYLGHDCYVYPISLDFLKQANLWCHAKNLQSLEQMLIYNIHCFWHETDDFTLTSRGVIWTYPGKSTTLNSVVVDLTKDWKERNYTCKGVCVDYI